MNFGDQQRVLSMAQYYYSLHIYEEIMQEKEHPKYEQYSYSLTHTGLGMVPVSMSFQNGKQNQDLLNTGQVCKQSFNIG